MEGKQCFWTLNKYAYSDHLFFFPKICLYKMMNVFILSKIIVCDWLIYPRLWQKFEDYDRNQKRFRRLRSARKENIILLSILPLNIFTCTDEPASIFNGKMNKRMTVSFLIFLTLEISSDFLLENFKCNVDRHFLSFWPLFVFLSFRIYSY